MNIFIEVDLSQAEWVVTAYAARDARMIEIVESGKDPHLETGHLISNAPREFILAEHAKIGHITNPDDISEIRQSLEADWPNLKDWFLPRIFSVRQMGKKSNHGLNYNMRYTRFALETELAESEAKRIIELYHHAYTGLRNSYYTWIQMCLKRDLTLRDCFGNKREFHRAWGNDLLDSAYAWLPQSTVGEIGKRGVVNVYTDSHSHMKDVQIAANVHDSILTLTKYESPEHLAFIVDRLRGHMRQTCEYHGRAFEIRTDVKIGTSWGNMEEVNFNTKDPIEELRRVMEVAQSTVQ